MSKRKVSLQRVFTALDQKDYSFFINLTQDEQKEISSCFTQIRYAANPIGSSDLQEYCLLAVNEMVNINFWEIAKNPEFAWMVHCAANPGIGSYKRIWIKAGAKAKANTKAEKFLAEIYPERKLDEIKLLAELNDNKTLRNIARDYGYTDAQIKAKL